MIKKKQITLMLIFFGILASAQVKIGNNPTVIGVSSLLELESTNKGLLLPRVALTSTTSFIPLLGPKVFGMTVYNFATVADVTPGIYVHNGRNWETLTDKDATATVSGKVNTTTQILGSGIKTFTSDLIVNGLTVGKGGGALQYNTVLGISALANNTIGDSNTGLGYFALKNNTTGISNTATGSNALASNTTGFYNTAHGFEALLANTIGNQNNANGSKALLSNISGNGNTGLGCNVMLNNTTGNYNTAVGYNSLQMNSTGSFNTSIGANTIFLNNPSNSIAIGANTTISTSNTVQVGDANITTAIVQVAWTITSDKRWKSNIKTSDLGLDFITKLNPVSYVRNNDESKKIEYGFIAQELEETLLKIGITTAGILSKNNEGMYQVRYNDFIAPMVKAIQEQQILIEEQQTINENQQKQIEDLKVVVERLTSNKKG